MKGLIYITILAFMFSCVQQLEWDGDENFGETLVVEGLVTNEGGPHYVLLSFTNPVITENETRPMEGAHVSIVSENETWILTEVERGRYETEPGVKGELGRSYQVRISWNGRSVVGEDQMVPMKEIEPIEIEEENDIPGLEGFHKFTMRDIFSTDEPYRYSIQFQKPQNIEDHYPADWEVPEWYLRSLDKNGRPVNEFAYYILPGPEPPALLSEGESIFTGIAKGTWMRETFYSMSEEHYEFIRAVHLETEWKGVSPISGKPSNVPSNLYGDIPVVGFFAVSEVKTNYWIVE